MGYAVAKTLHASAARTATGNTSAIDTRFWDKGMFRLEVTAASGTSPTLDVTIEAYDPAGDDWFTIGTFSQMTGTGSQVIAIGGGSDAEFVPDQIRVKYTIAGTTPSFTFSVGAIFR